MSAAAGERPDHHQNQPTCQPADRLQAYRIIILGDLPRQKYHGRKKEGDKKR